MEASSSAPGYICRTALAHIAQRSRWPTDTPEHASTALPNLPKHLRPPVSSSCCMIIERSASATASRARTSILGARSPIGGGRYRISRAGRKSTHPALESGARVTRGGHALVLAATDKRIACVVAQVPTISGYEQGSRRVPPEGIAALEAALNDDERAQARGESPRLQAIVNKDTGVPASYRTQDAIDFYLQPLSPGARWDNVVTMRSTRLARMYEPGVWAPRIGPTPLMMIVARQDTVTLTDLALEAYERAHEPKKLVMIPGGHFDPYLSGFDASCGAALKWFQEHLEH
jgi:fermentation-respiration switch protein FrsA (DUF1100 family)